MICINSGAFGTVSGFISDTDGAWYFFMFLGGFIIWKSIDVSNISHLMNLFLNQILLFFVKNKYLSDGWINYCIGCRVR